MELVEGEDLCQRIARGAIPLDEALPIAKQIAEALEAAHEQGIVHRDLKPANIKVRSDGTVKVLDFGLAKALETADGRRQTADGRADSPTITSPAMTQAGMILGTAAYMSPEQARGKTVDKRADIWAFGCLLHEMLTGTRLFGGDSVPETLGLIFSREPNLTTLPVATPAHVATLIARWLVKDPRQRLRDIGEARLALDDARDAPGADPGTPVVRSSARGMGPTHPGARRVVGLFVAAAVPLQLHVHAIAAEHADQTIEQAADAIFLIDAMRAHQLDGFAVQNPMRMGYLGVKTMVAHLRNQPVEKKIDTGVTMVTLENLDQPAIKDLRFTLPRRKMDAQSPQAP
jgi:serine/threonine protein kinase